MTHEATRLAEELRKAAAEIRAEGHNGWGNACADAADFLAALAQPAPTAEVALPAVSEEAERVAFEAKFPVPAGVKWTDDGYEVADSYMNSYACDRFVAKWIAWLARAQSAAKGDEGAKS